MGKRTVINLLTAITRENNRALEAAQDGKSYRTASIVCSTNLIAGRSALARQIATEALIDYAIGTRHRNRNRNVQRYAAPAMKPLRLVKDVLAIESDTPTVVVYENINQLTERDRPVLQFYVDNPTPNVYLIATATSALDPKGESWLEEPPQGSRTKPVFQTIRANDFTEEALRKYCLMSGLGDNDTDWLIERLHGDSTEIVALLDLYSVFIDPEPGLIRKLVPQRLAAASVFEQFGVFDTNIGPALYRQLKVRLRQGALLTELVSPRQFTPIRDLAAHISDEQIVVKHLLGVVRKYNDPNWWIARLAGVSALESYGREDQPGAREALIAVLLG